MARATLKPNKSPEEVQQAVNEIRRAGLVEVGDVVIMQDGQQYQYTGETVDLLGRQKVSGLKSGDASIGVNPKDKIGSAKVSYSLCPSSARIAWALAQMDGATKYGAYNWRVEPVQLRTYIDAATRHLDDFLEGEEFAPDSGVHHLGHVMACCAIMIDAMQHGTFTDDRPINGEGSKGLDSAAEFIKTKPTGWGK